MNCFRSALLSLLSASRFVVHKFRSWFTRSSEEEERRRQLRRLHEQERRPTNRLAKFLSSFATSAGFPENKDSLTRGEENLPLDVAVETGRGAFEMVHLEQDQTVSVEI